MAIGPVEELQASFDALFTYCRKLEQVVALLVVQHGRPHQGGYRICINDEDRWDLLRRLGTTEPTVLQQHDMHCCQLVVDIL